MIHIMITNEYCNCVTIIIIILLASNFVRLFIALPILHLTSSDILTELSLRYSLVLCSISAMHIAQSIIIMSSSFRLVYWIGF